jgi:hypothetical protein
MGSKPGIQMHPCTAKYAAAIADPFSDMALNACVPMGTSNTLKAYSMGIGNMTVGTGGVGAIVIVPSGYNDVGGAYLTNVNYTPALLDFSGAFGSQWDWLPATRLPFASGNYLGINARVVSAGVRIKYIGPLNARNGTIDLVVQPTHDALSTGTAGNLIYQANLSGFPENYHAAVTAETYSLNVYGVSQRECEFPEASAGVSNYFIKGCSSNLSNENNQYWFPFGGSDPCLVGNDGTNNWFLPSPNAVVYVRAEPGTLFDVEYVVHVEYTGQSATFGLTRVEADPEGVARVREAAAESVVNANANGQSFKRTFARSLVDVFRENAPIVAKAAANSLLNYLTQSPADRVLSTALMG